MADRILIIEDEPIVAISYAAILRQAGIDVVGPAGTLEQALQVIEHEAISGAMLDLNLFDRSAEPVAAALRQRGIPFIIVSGLPPEDVQQRFGIARLLSKPCRAVDLIEAVHALTTPAKAEPEHSTSDGDAH
jgi:DNA-binding response OmpR family regulator